MLHYTPRQKFAARVNGTLLYNIVSSSMLTEIRILYAGIEASGSNPVTHHHTTKTFTANPNQRSYAQGKVVVFGRSMAKDSLLSALN